MKIIDFLYRMKIEPIDMIQADGVQDDIVGLPPELKM